MDRPIQEVLKRPFLQFPGILAFVGLASVGLNLLMLTGPLFMLQVYDRVLPSHSRDTLYALLVLVIFLYAALGVLDMGRARILSRMSTRMSLKLRDTIQDAVLRAALVRGEPVMEPVRDFSTMTAFMGGPALAILFDVPMMVIYLSVIYLLHPNMFLLAFAGALLLFGLAVLNHVLSADLQQKAANASANASRVLFSIMRAAETVIALGMRRPVFARLEQIQDKALWWETRARERISGMSALTRSFRLFLQSAMLALGAWNVLNDEMTGGMMIMGTILLGRTLQPVEQAITQWRAYQRYRIARDRLASFIERQDGLRTPAQETRPEDRSRGHLVVEDLGVAPPGNRRPILRGVRFRLEPGQILWIVGANGSGKTLLARSLCGTLPVLSGRVLLDGADIAAWPEQERARLIGYLPQEVHLLEGSIAENIARFDPDAREEDVIAAARQAGVHEAIKRNGGYDRPVGPDGRWLSGGMRQRVALARTFYGDPVLAVLDEPFTALDAPGRKALAQALLALKEEGKALIVIDHMPALERIADLRLMLENGTARLQTATRNPASTGLGAL